MGTLSRSLFKVRSEALKAPTKMNLVDWADQNRVLSAGSSSQAGKWKTSKVEVARGPMLAVTEKGVHTISVMACTQLMKTELINNIVGYFIDQDPSPIIVMQPTGKLVDAWSKDRLDKMLRDTPCLQDRVGDKRSKDAENTIEHKVFPGGHISIVASNSPANLAMRPVRVVLCDEVDKYPSSAGDEGDPIKLVSERSATFWNRLKVYVCSPTNEGSSRIALEYESSDRRVYEVPCEHCGHKHEMKWEHVRWPKGEPEKALYHCPECGAEWTEPERVRSIGKGEWRATKPFKGHAGFVCNKLSSPWESMGQLALKFEDAKKKPMLLKTFINTQLAETWKEKSEAPDWKRLFNQRENYKEKTVPTGVCFLTAGVDIQRDRIEMQVRGWGRDKENWLIDYLIFDGDTSGVDVWSKLETAINKYYQHENGVDMPIKLTAIDSGYNTQAVYEFCRKFSRRKVIAIKGQDSATVAISQPKIVDVNIRSGKRIRRGARVYSVGVSILKQEIYSWLRLDKPTNDTEQYPGGYCHHYEIGEDYFKQLTAERLVERSNTKGYTRWEWQKFRERNEALDTFVYARAAASAEKIDRMKEDDFVAMEKELGVHRKPSVSKQSKKEEENLVNKEVKRKSNRRRSSIW